MKAEKMIAKCQYCQQLTPIESMRCTHCGTSLAAGQTYRLTESDLQGTDTLRSANGQWGSAFIDPPQPLVMEIAGQQLSLPTQPVVVLGRWSFSTEEPPLDVDLSYFRASAQGVSRHHIMISRKGPMAYVTDLNTSNGTWLNDQRLVSHNPRVLRNSDHLRLGRLDMRIWYGKVAAQLEVNAPTNAANSRY